MSDLAELISFLDDNQLSEKDLFIVWEKTLLHTNARKYVTNDQNILNLIRDYHMYLCNYSYPKLCTKPYEIFKWGKMPFQMKEAIFCRNE